MDWWHALLLGIVQGLTEFLPVSSSGHLMIFKELLGADPVSMIPVGIVGLLFKDKIEALFGDNLATVAIFLIVTAVLLFLSDLPWRKKKGAALPSKPKNEHRNGISWLQSFVVGIGQALAVAPGLSRSGTTIATGLLCGVKREAIAQFSFLMVLVPIIGEQLLEVLKGISGAAPTGGGVGAVCLLGGFASAFISGLVACKAMVALVKKARLYWFSIYCITVAAAILIFTIHA